MRHTSTGLVLGLLLVLVLTLLLLLVLMLVLSRETLYANYHNGYSRIACEKNRGLKTSETSRNMGSAHLARLISTFNLSRHPETAHLIPRGVI